MISALLELRLVKTPKGAAEIRERSAGLHPRLRQLLVMVDGSLRGADLAARAVALGGGIESVEHLLRGGFIAPDGVAGIAPSPALTSDQIGRAKPVLRRYLKVAAMAGDVRPLSKQIDAAHDGGTFDACVAELLAFFDDHANPEAAAGLRRELDAALGVQPHTSV